MNALLVTVTINDREPALAVLREQIVPRASQAPGFVTGYWLVSDDNRGTSVLVFESAEAAQRLGHQRGYLPTSGCECLAGGQPALARDDQRKSHSAGSRCILCIGTTCARDRRKLARRRCRVEA